MGCGPCIGLTFRPDHIESRPLPRRSQVGLVQGPGIPCQTHRRFIEERPQVGVVQGAGIPCHTDRRLFGNWPQVGVVYGPQIGKGLSLV